MLCVETDFDNINNFALQAGLRLLFDLNLLLRNVNNEWNSSNAQMLLNYAMQMNYSSNMDFELGNGMFCSCSLLCVIIIILCILI